MFLLHPNKWQFSAYQDAMMWTVKFSHIRVKCNHWCWVWQINFHYWESNISTGSTLLQDAFTIGKLKLIISRCTKNRICCNFVMWMTGFIVWKCVVSTFLTLTIFLKRSKQQPSMDKVRFLSNISFWSWPSGSKQIVRHNQTEYWCRLMWIQIIYF